MDTNKIFKFLIDLKFNNNRNWFKQNEKDYREASAIFGEIVDSIITEIKTFDNEIDVSSHKDCVFRIYKDVRFSKDKSPYKTNFGGLIAKGGRKSPYAGYYLHFEPDSSFIGGGVYMPESAILKKVRTKIFEEPEKFIKITNDKKFKTVFPEIYGEQLKKAPKDFPSDFQYVDLLKFKSYAVIHEVSNEFWEDKNLIKRIVEIYKTQYEFNRFLNEAIG